MAISYWLLHFLYTSHVNLSTLCATIGQVYERVQHYLSKNAATTSFQTMMRNAYVRTTPNYNETALQNRLYISLLNNKCITDHHFGS